MERSKALLFLALTLLLFARAGDPWADQLQKYDTIMDLVRENYPDAGDDRKMVEDSIRGFLAGLDPHSYFLDRLALRSLIEDQQGNFFGVGIRVSKYGSRLTVMAALKGLPAERAGIMAGDVIAWIDGHETSDMAMETAMGLLRGAKDSEVAVRVQRPEQRGLLEFRMRRELVPLDTITYALAFPGRPGIGYISVRLFGSRTAAELKAALERLNRAGRLRGLILDLRDNPGGSLEAAVETADLFLPKGRLIVTIRSRSASQPRLARKNGQYEDLPLAVLVSRASASASEIVAAALQDNGRAKIVGQRTFGKGLVETLKSLPYGYAMALTTARYFTPAGRSLQRDFSSLQEYYGFAYGRDYDGSPDLSGGVRPDLLVKPQPFLPLVVTLISRGLLFEFSRRLAGDNRSIGEDFSAGDGVLEMLHAFLAEKGTEVDAAEWDASRTQLRTEIERLVLTSRFSLEAGLKSFLRHDPVCRKALDLLPPGTE